MTTIGVRLRSYGKMKISPNNYWVQCDIINNKNELGTRNVLVHDKTWIYIYIYIYIYNTNPHIDYVDGLSTYHRPYIMGLMT